VIGTDRFPWRLPVVGRAAVRGAPKAVEAVLPTIVVGAGELRAGAFLFHHQKMNI